IPRLPEIYDEPFADSSQLPTYLVAALARKHVTVALSGDGGDEDFGGYILCLRLARRWRKNALEDRPLPARRAGGQRQAGAMRGVSVSAWDDLYKLTARALPGRWRQRLPGEKVHKTAGVLEACDPKAMYVALASHWQQPEDIVIGAREPLTAVRNGNASG